MLCAVCGKVAESPEETVQEGWIPSFFEDRAEYGPACTECARIYLEEADDGRMRLKPVFWGKIVFWNEE